jgi:2-polyprenyl-6-methoxyphenol hydroxylase-like FAD-dependent oxidoreductase
MGGLLAARTLADFYERVTVIERDEIPADTDYRRGVPQGRHFHTILLRGAQVLDAMFPGLVDELVAAGAPTSNFMRDARFVLAGNELIRTDTGALAIQLTRPMLEGTIRARVAAIPGVKIVDGCDVVGLKTSGGRVTGARIVNRTPGSKQEILEAGLVVDAMGRAGRAKAWLGELGYRPPAEDRIRVDIAYVSRFVRLAPGTSPSATLVLVGPVAGRPTGFALAAQEGDRWMLTVVGMAGDHPPDDDEAAFLAFIKRAAPPDVYEVIRKAEPLTELRVHKFQASVWRRYEKLRRFPTGLLAFGDAICSFNPIYGQGMTVAALEASALRRCLLDGDQDLARRFFRAAAKVIAPVWQLNAGGDLAVPEIEGHRPLATRVINRYVARLQQVARHDAKVATAFVRVIGLLDPPPAMMAPGIVARVMIGGRSRLD